MKIPIKLYNIENKLVETHCISTTTNFFVRSFQNFSIEIIEGEAIIYSVIENPNSTNQDDLFIIEKNTKFDSVNHNYTIFIKEGTIKFKVTGIIDKTPVIYELTFRDINFEPEHYADFLTNKYLPTYEELLPALIDQDNAELIKRLLLDYKKIVKYKGTIVGIEKFLNFIGFNPESIKIYSEYITPDEIKTINPNKLIDIKTGDYHVLFDNYIVNPDEPYTIKNLPRRIINITNLEEFFERLYYAIALANIYFTLPEQDISFFGISYSANNEQYLSIAGRPNVMWNQDPHYFHKLIKINLIEYVTQDIINSIIKNTILSKSNTIYKSEYKYRKADTPTNTELYLVDEEIFDDETGDLDIVSKFGNILHFDILAPNNYIEYKIEHSNNPFSAIIQPKTLLGDTPHRIVFAANRAGLYKISVLVTDNYNNQEKYFYEFIIDDKIANIDFDMYNSVELLDTKLRLESSGPITAESINYILPLDQVPNLLSTYFDIVSNDKMYMTNLPKYILPEINKNFIVDNSTEIPIDFMDNWVDILSVRKPVNKSLKLRYINAYTLKPAYSNIGEIVPNKCESDDLLFVTDMEILESTGYENYIFISTQCIGIEINKTNFDFVFIDEDDNVTSIFDENITLKRLPVNYDYQLFHRFTSNVNYPEIDLDDPETMPIVESIFPRLTKNNFQVKLGETVACEINRKLVTNDIDVSWEIRNAFNNELIFETKEYILKYRVSDKMIFSVILNFKLKNEPGSNYQIVQKSIFSSL